MRAAAGQRLVAADAAAQRLLATHAAVLRVAVREAAPGVAASPVLQVAASHDLALAALRGSWRTRHGVNVDFRGSAEYRKAMAGVLAERALQQAWQGAIA